MPGFHISEDYFKISLLGQNLTDRKQVLVFVLSLTIICPKNHFVDQRVRLKVRSSVFEKAGTHFIGAFSALPLVPDKAVPLPGNCIVKCVVVDRNFRLVVQYTCIVFGDKHNFLHVKNSHIKRGISFRLSVPVSAFLRFQARSLILRCWERLSSILARMAGGARSLTLHNSHWSLFGTKKPMLNSVRNLVR